MIGPSGAGKTTLLRVLGTALRPTGGQVAVLGSDPWQLGAGALRRAARADRRRPPGAADSAAAARRHRGARRPARHLADLEGARLAAACRATPPARARRSPGSTSTTGCSTAATASPAASCSASASPACCTSGPTLILADEPVSALDPTLADEAVGALVARERGERRDPGRVAARGRPGAEVVPAPDRHARRRGRVRPPDRRGHAPRCCTSSTPPRAATLPVQGVEAAAPERAPNVLALRRPGCQ